MKPKLVASANAQIEEQHSKQIMIKAKTIRYRAIITESKSSKKSD